MSQLVSRSIFRTKPTASVDVIALFSGQNFHRPNMLRRCCFAFVCPDLFGDKVFYGLGSEPNTEGMLAHMIPKVVNVIAKSSAADAAINLILPKIGTQRYFEEFIWKWLADAEKNPNKKGVDHELWKAALLHLQIGHVSFVKGSPEHEETLAKLFAFTRGVIKKALRDKEPMRTGLVRIGIGKLDEPPSPSPRKIKSTKAKSSKGE